MDKAIAKYKIIDYFVFKTIDLRYENEIKRKARAARAGLNGFLPKPPKPCLQIVIANIEPMAAIQSGKPAGRSSASKRPVRTAEKSPIVPSRFMAKRHIASTATQVEIQTAIVHTAGIPKNHIPAAVVGKSAIITSSIMRETLACECACGLELKIK